MKWCHGNVSGHILLIERHSQHEIGWKVFVLSNHYETEEDDLFPNSWAETQLFKWSTPNEKIVHNVIGPKK